MQYDDEIRQYNFMSGLALGALLGVGLTLLSRPTTALVRRRRRKGWRQRSELLWEELREGVTGGLDAAVSAGRERLRR